MRFSRLKVERGVIHLYHCSATTCTDDAFTSLFDVLQAFSVKIGDASLTQSLFSESRNLWIRFSFASLLSFKTDLVKEGVKEFECVSFQLFVPIMLYSLQEFMGLLKIERFPTFWIFDKDCIDSKDKKMVSTKIRFPIWLFIIVTFPSFFPKIRQIR